MQRFGPKNLVLFRKIDWDFGGSKSLNTQPTCFEFFNEGTGFLLGRLSISVCLNTHSTPRICIPIQICNLTFGSRPRITRRIHAVSSKRLLIFPSWKTTASGRLPLWGFFPSFCVCVLGAGEDCRRGGKCKHPLLNTVLLLSIDSFLLFSFQRWDCFLSESWSILLFQLFRFWLWNFVSWSFDLCVSSPRSSSSDNSASINLDGFLVRTSPIPSGAERTLVFASCTNFPEHYLWALCAGNSEVSVDYERGVTGQRPRLLIGRSAQGILLRRRHPHGRGKDRSQSSGRRSGRW